MLGPALIRRLLVVCVAVCCCTNFADADAFDDFAKDYPTPFTDHNRVMGFILNFDYGHIDPLDRILEEYVSMCEGGWDPSLVIHTTVARSAKMMRNMAQKTYCYRTNRSIPIRMDLHDPSVGTGLGMKHKKFLREEMNNSDIFLYHEDDIVFKFSHLAAFVNETKTLYDLDPELMRDHIFGFQRYYRILRGERHGDPYTEKDVLEQDLLEEVPQYHPICIKDKPYLVASGNTHQAIWLFTAAQVRYLQERCNFADHEQPSREFMSSFLVFEHKSGHCAMNKLIGAERLYTMSILHYYHQKHMSWKLLSTADENLRAGYHLYSEPRVRLPSTPIPKFPLFPNSPST